MLCIGSFFCAAFFLRSLTSCDWTTVQTRTGSRKRCFQSQQLFVLGCVLLLGTEKHRERVQVALGKGWPLSLSHSLFIVWISKIPGGRALFGPTSMGTKSYFYSVSLISNILIVSCDLKDLYCQTFILNLFPWAFRLSFILSYETHLRRPQMNHRTVQLGTSPGARGLVVPQCRAFVQWHAC